MADCLFCKIVAGEIPAKIVYRDDHAIGFSDLNPQAPLHALVVPRAHVARLADLSEVELGGRLLLAARRVASDAGYGDGFRVVVNSGDAAGQTVKHLHVHVLGGRKFSWPPG